MMNTLDLSAPILVTGSTGNVGREVVRCCLARGLPVRAAVRSVDGETNLPSAVQRVAFDFQNPATFPAALAGVQQVFLLRPPQLGRARDLRPFIRAAHDAGVQHVVFLSLMGVSINPFTPHFWTEWLLRFSGMRHTFLRPSFFLQNLDTFYRDAIQTQNEVLVPAGKGKVSLVDVRDIGAVAAAVFADPAKQGTPYTLTGPAAVDWYQVAEALTAELGSPIVYREPDMDRYTMYLRGQGHPDDFIQVQTMLMMVLRNGWSAGVTDDIARLLGRPATDLRTYVRDYWGKSSLA